MYTSIFLSIFVKEEQPIKERYIRYPEIIVLVNLKNKNLKMLILSYQILIGQSVCNDITLHYITLHYIT